MAGIPPASATVMSVFSIPGSLPGQRPGGACAVFCDSRPFAIYCCQELFSDLSGSHLKALIRFINKPRNMSRNLVLTTAAALVAAMAIIPVSSLRAQIGTIMPEPAPRPPSSIPRGYPMPPPPDDSEEEDVPQLPQGRVLPAAPSRAPEGNIMPGPVQSRPLPPPPGSAMPPVTASPEAPGSANPMPGNPPSNQPLAIGPPGLQPPPETTPAPGGTRVARPQTTPPANVPRAPASLMPGDEVMIDTPTQKILNKKATFSGLDKITGRIINFDQQIGETVQFGALRIKTDACYTRPATEAANTDAFVEVEEITLQGDVKRIFSGWMFAASPGLHGVEHPIYDVWLTDCKEPETQTASAAPDTPKPASTQRRPQSRGGAAQPARPPQPPPVARQPAQPVLPLFGGRY